MNIIFRIRPLKNNIPIRNKNEQEKITKDKWFSFEKTLKIKQKSTRKI